jgi:hypothetical protein
MGSGTSFGRAFVAPPLNAAVLRAGEGSHCVSLKARLVAWRSKVKSVVLGGWASGQVGRVSKLRKVGRPRQALETAHRALARLRMSDVPPQGLSYAIVVLTIQVEQLAKEVGGPGANPKDLATALESLREPSVRRLPAHAEAQLADVRRDWIPYLKARLAKLRTE